MHAHLESMVYGCSWRPSLAVTPSLWWQPSWDDNVTVFRDSGSSVWIGESITDNWRLHWRARTRKNSIPLNKGYAKIKYFLFYMSQLLKKCFSTDKPSIKFSYIYKKAAHLFGYYHFLIKHVYRKAQIFQCLIWNWCGIHK